MSDATSADGQVREWYAQATAFHKATLLDEAAALYEKILSAVPRDPAALHLLGVLRHAQGDYATAVRLLGDATTARPDSAPFHAAFGAALRGLGRTEEALAEYDRAILLQPDLAEAHNHRAVALQRMGHLDAAIDGYRAAIAARPDYAEAYNNLGTALRSAGRPEEALEAYRAALAQRPGYVDALGNLGKLEAELGRPLAAVETYRKLLERRPDDFDALSALGELLVVLDREEEALEPYAAALELRPRDPALLDRTAVALLLLDRFETAAGLLETALGIDRMLAPAWLHYGVALEKLGQVEGAEEALRTAISIDPAVPLAHFTLGTLLAATGRPDEARRVFADWYQRAPDHPTARHMMAAVSGAEVPARASAAYVIETFDIFAKTFDRQLAQLGYRAPQLIDDLLQARGTPADGTLDIADLGCGTGLSAPLLRPRARRLVGVDLAPGMLERARRRALYDELIRDDLVDFLSARRARFDLLVSADTLVYFGELAPVVAAAAGALRAGGRFAFTLEEAGEAEGQAPYGLGLSGRYRHRAAPVEDGLASAGFRILELRRDILRNEGDRPVHGLIVLAEIPGGEAV